MHYPEKAANLLLLLSYIPVAQKAIWNRVGVIKSSQVDSRGALTLWRRFGSMDSQHSW